MGRLAGTPSKIYVDEFDFSGRTNSAELAIDVTLPEVTTFADAAAEFVESIYNGSCPLNGFFDPDDDDYDEQMWTVLGEDIVHYLGLYLGQSAAYGNIGYELQARPQSQPRRAEVAGAVLLHVTWQGDGPIVRSTVLCNGAVTGAGVVTNSNQNIGGTGAHKVTDTTNPVTSDDATTQGTLETLLNEIKGDYNAHRISTSFHVAADTTNVVSSANASDLATALTLVNELKLDINAHRSQSGVHVNNDTVNVIGAVDATTLATAITLANEIKADYNLHLPECSKIFVAILRVLAVTGAGSITVEVEESQDDGGGDAYASVVAFTAKTGIGVERKTVSTITEAWKQVNVTAFSGFTSVTILVVVGTEQGVG